MLRRTDSYDELRANFGWDIPDFYNIGVDICDKWASRRFRTALIYENEKGEAERYTFRDLKRLSDKLANGLRACGIARGDRVGLLLPQCPETAISHIAVYKLGAITIPLFTLFGPEALTYRLTNSEAKAIVTDGANIQKILEIKDDLPDLEVIIVTGKEKEEGTENFWNLVEKGASRFTPVQTRADDPALIIYTSGTTGPPKGALHAHRTLLGHLPGVELPHDFFPQDDDLFWTPADWAWIGGLIDVLFPSWHHGVPVVAHRPRKFDPEYAFHFLAKYGIRNAFMPPTALKMMRQVENPAERHEYDMRTIGSGGETLGVELLSWGREVMRLSINEFYGQTEVNLVIANCSKCMETRPGSMGKTVPGHDVAVLDKQGNPMPAGEEGEIGIRAPDPVMFLEYWKNPEATKQKFIGNWSMTGDRARQDQDGYFWFVGRKDDIITSSGYRIGPAEVEGCLIKHPAVSMAAVVGSPDPVRTETVKAFILLKPGMKPGLPLARNIQEFVKTRLAAYEYPRDIEFVEELPLTATGKIKRRDLKQREIEQKTGGRP